MGRKLYSGRGCGIGYTGAEINTNVCSFSSVIVLYYLSVKLADSRVPSHLLSVEHILCGEL